MCSSIERGRGGRQVDYLFPGFMCFMCDTVTCPGGLKGDHGSRRGDGGNARSLHAVRSALCTPIPSFDFAIRKEPTGFYPRPHMYPCGADLRWHSMACATPTYHDIIDSKKKKKKVRTSVQPGYIRQQPFLLPLFGRRSLHVGGSSVHDSS